MQIIFTDGLGNQMFQYALYLAMKAKGRKPKINTGIATRSKVHNGFELCDAFWIDRESLPITLEEKFGGDITIFSIRFLTRLTCYIEDPVHFSNAVFNSHKPFINGYWQDIRYFKDVQDKVRSAFSFRNIDNANLEIGNEMEQCNSVSLHIRRGDYLKYPQYQVCTPSYYKRAIALIKENVNNPVFYVFSDDLDWSNHFMRDLGVSYKMVNLNRGRDSYKDMYLMTRCKHNIIANSSFSWWGAWLGQQEGKIVVRPDEWIKNSIKNPCPDSWLRTRAIGGASECLKKKRSKWHILCHEYEGLNTGRTPVAPYAIKAYYCSDNFRLIVQMRYMFNTKSISKRKRISRKLFHKYGLEISPKAAIGERIRFCHTAGVVIGDYVRMGNDCTVFQGVLLGQAKCIYPTIGDNVTLYPYSCVLGDVHVGNNVIILAHSIVLHDVPDNCMVGGNPAKIIKQL